MPTLFDKLLELHNNKTRCFINGIPDSDTKGTIVTVGVDYVEFETLKAEVEKTSKKEKTTRELIIIPIAKIETISSGEEVKETNLLQAALNA